ncbi:MAG: OsmC family peroxiredoxin [Alphaproteobacteria bacterium]|nr:OsmC family peroxiredoxin [Alphaproteobacteria bacterium]
MSKAHRYHAKVVWTGNQGTGTSGYKDYARRHEISAGTKPVIAGSSDAAFRGEAERWNPEDSLVGALAACHMLWYLHLAAEAGVVVEIYEDQADGLMVMDPDGGGHFQAATLRPRVTLKRGDAQTALALHDKAHALCFIARSVNFPVAVEPTIIPANGA